MGNAGETPGLLQTHSIPISLSVNQGFVWRPKFEWEKASLEVLRTNNNCTIRQIAMIVREGRPDIKLDEATIQFFQVHKDSKFIQSIVTGGEKGSPNATISVRIKGEDEDATSLAYIANIIKCVFPQAAGAVTKRYKELFRTAVEETNKLLDGYQAVKFRNPQNEQATTDDGTLVSRIQSQCAKIDRLLPLAPEADPPASSKPEYRQKWQTMPPKQKQLPIKSRLEIIKEHLASGAVECAIKVASVLTGEVHDDCYGKALEKFNEFRASVDEKTQGIIRGCWGAFRRWQGQ